jgi:transposase
VSALHIAEHLYKNTALAELLGVPAERINDDRLYRVLDRVLFHKDALQVFLKNRLGGLFDLDYELLLYDVTSTYFEGQANANPKARRGYSRDSRPDCKQVCIAMVATREGMPLGYETFAGNRADVTTVEEIVETMEDRYGRANRIWAMDRGMASQDNLEFLRDGRRRYIIGTPKGLLKQFERKRPSASIDRTCGSGRCGIRRKSGWTPISWCASWPTWCGRRWGRCASEPAWAMSRVGCWRNSAASAWWTWC